MVIFCVAKELTESQVRELQDIGLAEDTKKGIGDGWREKVDKQAAFDYRTVLSKLI